MLSLKSDRAPPATARTAKQALRDRQLTNLRPSMSSQQTTPLVVTPFSPTYLQQTYYSEVNLTPHSS